MPRPALGAGESRKPRALGGHDLHCQCDHRHRRRIGTTGDLLFAIDQANANPNPDGSMIEFSPTVSGSAQSITLSSTLTLSETAGPLVIEGPGANLLTVSGNNAVEVFSIGTGVSAQLTGLTISDGLAVQGGGLAIDGGTVSLTNVTVSNNQAAGANGAAGATPGAAGDGGTSALGGGIYLNGGSLTLNDDTIASNVVRGGYGGRGADGATGAAGTVTPPSPAAVMAAMVAPAATVATAWVAESTSPAAA